MTHASYTWLNARFRKSFSDAQNGRIEAGNRLAGAPEHRLFLNAEYRVTDTFNVALEMRAEFEVFVNDMSSDAASGYAY